MTDNAAVLSDLDAALAATGQIVAGVGPGQWRGARHVPSSMLALWLITWWAET
jgi:hypothetical protein